MNSDEELQKYAEEITRFPREIAITKGSEQAPYLTRALDTLLDQLASSRNLLVPNLQADNDTVMLFSDYGGESPDSKYLVYSFLVCAYKPLHFFRMSQEEARDKHGLNDPVKEIAFKSIGYAQQDRCLDDYLRNLSNLVPGMVVSVVVEKGTYSLWGEDRKADQAWLVETLADAGLGDWKPQIAEKLVTAVHIAAYLVALLAEEGQKVYWQTDHDAIVANEKKTEQFGELFRNVLPFYGSKKLGKVYYGRSLGKDDTMFLDLLSCPDLVAGALEHYLTRELNLAELTIKQEADKILQWHSVQGIGLKKYAFIFRNHDGVPKCGYLKIEPKKLPENFEFLDVNPPSIDPNF